MTTFGNWRPGRYIKIKIQRQRNKGDKSPTFNHKTERESLDRRKHLLYCYFCRGLLCMQLPMYLPAQIVKGNGHLKYVTIWWTYYPVIIYLGHCNELCVLCRRKCFQLVSQFSFIFFLLAKNLKFLKELKVNESYLIVSLFLRPRNYRTLFARIKYYIFAKSCQVYKVKLFSSIKLVVK